MLDRVFRIDFYPSEWLVHTGSMTLEQRGIFIQIVSMIYANRGPIENDPAWIGRAANCSPRLARSLISQLVGMDSIQIQGSKVSQKRCELELNKKRTHFEHSAKGGRTKHENQSETKENNDIASSDDDDSLSSPYAYAYAIASQEHKKDNPLPPAEPDGFAEFWEIYPRQRRGSKDKGMKAYARALERSTKEEIYAGTRRYSTSDEVARGFGKGAEAWLNDDRWGFDYRAPQSGKASNAGSAYGDSLARANEAAKDYLNQQDEIRKKIDRGTVA